MGGGWDGRTKKKNCWKKTGGLKTNKGGGAGAGRRDDLILQVSGKLVVTAARRYGSMPSTRPAPVDHEGRRGGENLRAGALLEAGRR